MIGISKWSPGSVTCTCPSIRSTTSFSPGGQTHSTVFHMERGHVAALVWLLPKLPKFSPPTPFAASNW